MSTSELEKIINDGLAKYKVFKEANGVIGSLKSLEQARSDLLKVVSALEKRRDDLANNVKQLESAVNDSHEQARLIKSRAEQDAKAVISEAENALINAKKQAEDSLKQAIQKIKDNEAKAVAAHNAAIEAEIKLAEINKELEAAKERARKILG